MKRGNRYLEVARTYVRWPIMCLMGFAFATALIVVIFVFFSEHRRELQISQMSRELLIPHMSVVILLAFVIGNQLKEQFANHRSRTMPHFGRPHLVVAAVIAMTVCALITVMLSMSGRLAVMGTAALVVTVFTATLWWVYLKSLWAGLAWVGAGLWCIYPFTHDYANALAYGPTAPWLLVVNALALALLGKRLTQLHEDMPGYYQRFDPGPLSVSMPSPGDGSAWFGELNRPWRRVLLNLRDRHFDLSLRDGTWGRAQSISRWRLPTRESTTPWLMATMCLCFYLFFKYLVGADIGLIMVMIAIFPVSPFIIGIAWWNRRNLIGYESLRPVRRDDFMRQLGFAVAMDLGRYCAIVLLIGVAILGIKAINDVPGSMPPSMLMQPQRWLVAWFSCLSASVLTCAVGLWLLRSKSNVMLSVVMFIMFYSLSIVLYAFGLIQLHDYRTFLGRWIAFGVAMLVASVAVTYDAYRRWLRTDLG